MISPHRWGPTRPLTQSFQRLIPFGTHHHARAVPPWQNINLKKYPGMANKLKKHWKLFRELWASFEIVAEHAINVGAAVCLEWPKSNAYWKVDVVKKFLTKHGFKSLFFDGCMYGLKATSKKHRGLPIRKEWRIDDLNTCLPNYLNTTCREGVITTPLARGRIP